MSENEVDELESFALDFRRRAPTFGHMPQDILSNYKIHDVTGLVWFRHGQFQVEMFIVPPHYIIPEHTHPNVSSYEMYVGGDIAFSHSGKWVTDENLIKMPGAPDNRGALIKVRTSDKHGGSFGDNGGVFISIQQWLNGVAPHSVALDYDGVALAEEHLDMVKEGNAYTKENLTWKDVASLESEGPVFNTITL